MWVFLPSEVLIMRRSVTKDSAKCQKAGIFVHQPLQTRVTLYDMVAGPPDIP